VTDVFHAENVAQAHLVLAMLKENGIEAFVENEHLADAFGKLPIDLSTRPTVRVKDAGRLEEAVALVAAWRHAGQGPGWTCPSCGEPNGSAFEVCWSCGRPAPPQAGRVYGQQEQMEHPTMVGTLSAQAEMIWPLERPIFERLGLPDAQDVLDVGCGTGEAAGRIARTWTKLRVTGVDLFPGHLDLARKNHPEPKYPNLTFRHGDARKLDFPDRSFGAVLSRHMLHAIPDADDVLREARRLLRPDGLLYVLAEDYMGILYDAPKEPRDLYLDAAPGMLRHGTDLLFGRSAFRRVRAAGFEDVRVDTIVVDTVNSSRETFARMLEHWRDGYAGILGGALGLPADEVSRRFDGQIAAVRDPERYACWLLLAVSGRASS
jgi:SAM-dependent methyltransferase